MTGIARNCMHSRLFSRAACIAMTCALLGIGRADVGARFTVPDNTSTETWQAEQAVRSGPWRVAKDEAMGQSTYMAARGSGEGAVLEFPFTVGDATTLRVRPVFARHGSRQSARLFPYPMDRSPGPDVVVSLGDRVYFTAPATGRIGIVDPASEKLVGSIDVGGYLTDMVADPERGRLYVADALGDRVAVTDPGASKVARVIPVPAEPWSLTQLDGKLYVACRGARCVAEVDLLSARVVGSAELPAAPVHVQALNEPERCVKVVFESEVFHVTTLERQSIDKLQYPAPARRTTRREGFDSEIQVGKAFWFVKGEPGQAAVAQAKDGAIDATIDVGGRIVDIAADGDRERLYLADAAASRIVVLDTKQRKVVGEIPLDDAPGAIALVPKVAIHFAFVVAPTPVNRLFIACPRARKLVVVDTLSDSVVQSLPLPGAPTAVRMLPLPDPGWWPMLSEDRTPIELTPRIAVDLAPAALRPGRLARIDGMDVPPGIGRRTTALTPIPGAAAKQFAGTNQLVLNVDGKRPIDVSTVADPQEAPARTLCAKDTPGSITLSLDGGPEQDFTRQVWMDPMGQRFLVNETDGYWDENAPVLQVKPGRHVLRIRAHDSDATLDALEVWRDLTGDVDITVLPEPRETHAPVTLTHYYGVFYDAEPIRFTVRLSAETALAAPKVSYTLLNYMQERVAEGAVHLGPSGALSVGQHAEAPLGLAPEDTGRFTLRLVVDADRGRLTREFPFLRLPKLEHPRLFYRKDDIPAIQARIAENPKLYQRWLTWLRAKFEEEHGNFPERFVPPGLTKDLLNACAPPAASGQGAQNCGWRMYELGWRMIAAQFAADFLEKPGDGVLGDKMAKLLASEKTDAYCQFHHHGPFFPGAVAGVWDMAPEEQRKGSRLGAQFESQFGSMDVYPWTLVTLEEPLTPEKRAVAYKIMQWESNLESYFETHRGTRGGTWWQNPWTWCHCSLQGQSTAFFYTSNVFGERRVFEKPLFNGFLTFTRYTDPISDTRHILPERRGPQGEPWRWIECCLPKHPYEQGTYEWKQWFEKLSGDLPAPEEETAKRLFELEGMKLRGRLQGHSNYFVTGAFAPVVLALGWYDPEQPIVQQEELPETALFDVEGWAAMRSGWDKDATEVTFVSGIRDHTYRHQPNHFTIVKGGEFLVGTPSLVDDDGWCQPVWGNVVVAGDRWPDRWRVPFTPPRGTEYAVIDRFSASTWTYITRDRMLSRYRPAEGGWGGGVDLHGHTQTVLTQEGEVVAYETHPEFDYVAGDAARVWPTSEVKSAYRQLVFIKPDLVVVYDRLVPAPGVRDARWLACVGPQVDLRGDRFRVIAKTASLSGAVLLPQPAVIAAPKSDPAFVWKDQRPIEIWQPASDGGIEYLVVMRTGGHDAPDVESSLIRDRGRVGASIRDGDRTVRVLFNRTGALGGQLVLSGPVGRSDFTLVDRVDDSYRHWSADPRYEKWMTEDRFRFIIPKVESGV